MAAQREVKIHIIFCAVTIFLVTVFFQTNCIGEELFKKPLNNSLQSFSLTLKCCKGQFRLSLRNDVRTCTLIYLLLIQAADIEINPGPRYPCGICKKNVNWNSKAFNVTDATYGITLLVQKLAQKHSEILNNQTCLGYAKLWTAKCIISTLY